MDGTRSLWPATLLPGGQNHLPESPITHTGGPQRSARPSVARCPASGDVRTPPLSFLTSAMTPSSMKSRTRRSWVLLSSGQLAVHLCVIVIETALVVTLETADLLSDTGACTPAAVTPVTSPWSRLTGTQLHTSGGSGEHWCSAEPVQGAAAMSSSQSAAGPTGVLTVPAGTGCAPPAPHRNNDPFTCFRAPVRRRPFLS